MNLNCSKFKIVENSKLLLNIIQLRKFTISVKCLRPKAYTIELDPDVDEKLTAGAMKHRKHPGVRKMAPIQMPKELLDAVDRVVPRKEVKKLLQEAADIRIQLQNRRFPLERQEIQEKMKKFQLKLGASIEDLPEVLKKEQLVILRKQIVAEANRWKPLEDTPQACMAYLIARLAANYASTLKVLTEIQHKLPDFHPRTMFDFGSGVGSSVWASRTLWKDSIEEVFCVDAAEEMNNLCQNLLLNEETGAPIIKNLFMRQFLPASENIKYDLVVSAFSLMELTSVEERLKTIDILWRKTKNLLVIIELGTKAGFQAVLDSRDFIMQIENGSEKSIYSTGAHIIAPCTHDMPCPRLEETDVQPCGFHVNYETIFPRHKELQRKDFISYVIIQRGNRSQEVNTWPRIVKPVLSKSKHVLCRLCCSDGKLHELVVTRSRHGRHAYRCARSSQLGDLLPVNVKHCSEISNEQYSESHDSDQEDENVL